MKMAKNKLFITIAPMALIASLIGNVSLVHAMSVSMSRPVARVVVIGRARSGKSFLGNKLRSEGRITGAEAFKTSASSDPCTEKIRRLRFSDWNWDNEDDHYADGTYEITYVDTPGFPVNRVIDPGEVDQRADVEESIDNYNMIVKYINSSEITAIIWLLNPTRHKQDAPMFRNYALLMKEFTNKKIHFAVLANGHGDYEMNAEQVEDNYIEVDKILSGYGLEALGSEVDTHTSVSSKFLKATFISIVDKALKYKKEKNEVGKIRTFQEMERSYKGEYNGHIAEKAEEAVIEKMNCELEKMKNDVVWYKEKVRTLNIAVDAVGGGAAAGAGAASIFGAFTMGIGAAICGGIAAGGGITVGLMKIAIKTIGKKIEDLQLQIDREEKVSEVDSTVVKEEAKEDHRNSMNKLAQIYEAMGRGKEAEDLRTKAKKL